MTRRAIRELSAEGVSRAQIEHELFADMRYRGQSYELEVALTPRFIEEFHAAHQQTFGHSAPESPVEVVNLRLRSSASGPSVAPRKIAKKRRSHRRHVAQIDTLGRRQNSPRAGLFARDLGRGREARRVPLMIVELSSTSYVAPEFAMRVDDFGNLHLEMRA